MSSLPTEAPDKPCFVGILNYISNIDTHNIKKMIEDFLRSNNPYDQCIDKGFTYILETNTGDNKTAINIFKDVDSSIIEVQRLSGGGSSFVSFLKKFVYYMKEKNILSPYYFKLKEMEKKKNKELLKMKMKLYL